MQHRSFIGNNMFQCANVTACKSLVTQHLISNLTHFPKTRNKKTTVGTIMERNYVDIQGQMGGNTAGFDPWGEGGGGICHKCDQKFEVCLFKVYSSIMLYV
uniref:Uncharacterized protein n=1 Tax=Rhipicephalus zambeziensis TaxID=60191 RepID=A0A224Y9S8_9ACAR